MNKLDKFLSDNFACIEGVDYCKGKTISEAWNKCERGDWMLWFSHRRGVDVKILTKVKALCAKTVIHLMKDKRSIDAIEVAIKYSNGDALQLELDDAADSAALASSSAFNNVLCGYSEACAADAAYYAAEAFSSADAVIECVSDAFKDSYEVLKQCADICREHIPFELIDIEG